MRDLADLMAFGMVPKSWFWNLIISSWYRFLKAEMEDTWTPSDLATSEVDLPVAIMAIRRLCQGLRMRFVPGFGFDPLTDTSGLECLCGVLQSSSVFGGLRSKCLCRGCNG